MRKIEYLYSFDEYLTFVFDENPNVITPWDALTLKDTLNEVISNLHCSFSTLPFVTMGTGDTIASVSSNVEKLWSFIKGRYFNNGFIKTNEEIESFISQSSAKQKEYSKPFINLMTKVALGFFKYDKILTLYASNESKLMNQIASSTSGSNTSANVNKRNETPQNEGDYSADKYATEVSRNENEAESTITNLSDKDTTIMRLAEIQNMYKNILADWCIEIERCFYEEEV